MTRRNIARLPVSVTAAIAMVFNFTTNYRIIKYFDEECVNSIKGLGPLDSKYFGRV